MTTHATLLARLARGGGEDARAWEEFCGLYGELIRGFARRQGLQPSDCDEVLQEVLLALTKALPGIRYDPAKGKFRSYLKTVTLHTIFRRARQKRHVRPLDLDGVAEGVQGSDPALEAIWEEEWRQHHLQRALAVIEREFGPADRSAFQMYAVAGRDARETAAALGLSVDQVYQAKSRIIRRLSQIIEVQVREEG